LLAVQIAIEINSNEVSNEEASASIKRYLDQGQNLYKICMKDVKVKDKNVLKF
jgi:hypothetical protein